MVYGAGLACLACYFLEDIPPETMNAIRSPLSASSGETCSLGTTMRFPAKNWTLWSARLVVAPAASEPA